MFLLSSNSLLLTGYISTYFQSEVESMQSEESRLDDLIRLVAYVLIFGLETYTLLLLDMVLRSLCSGKDKKLSDPWRKMNIVEGIRQFI